LLEWLGPALAGGGERPAVIFDDGFTLTCDAWREHTERLAAALSARIAPGDRVALAVGNRSEFLIAYFAIVACRAVVVTLSPSIGSADAEHVLRDAGCMAVIADPIPARVIDMVRAHGEAHIDLFEMQGTEPDGLVHLYDGERRLALADVAASVDEMVDIGYTSGTTGLPKALPGSHAELWRYTDMHLRTVAHSAGDRILCPLQFHYGDPIWITLASVLLGEPAIVMRRFSVARFWRVAREFGATQIVSIGSIPNLLLSAPPSPDDRDHGVRLAIAVGVPKEQHAELERRFGFPWLEYYGSSESGPAIAMPPDAAARYVGSGAIGVPYPDIEARVVDGDGEPIDGLADGELELSGAILFEGYLNAPEATAEVLHDGWLRTGDLVRRDEDGVFYFLGRRKELIRRGGENIAPAEVEAVLRLHPDVVDAAVVPVADGLRGEEVKAYVELVPGSTLDESELVAFCAPRLAAFKLPRYVELRTEPFPRTPSQRIPKERLKTDGAHATATAWDREAQSAEGTAR
jgi:crotonobetaine/carnitine-CoA ligase